jgi:hypothetical protein
VQWLAEMLPDARRDPAAAEPRPSARQRAMTRRSSRRSPRRRRRP